MAREDPPNDATMPTPRLASRLLAVPVLALAAGLASAQGGDELERRLARTGSEWVVLTEKRE